MAKPSGRIALVSALVCAAVVGVTPAVAQTPAPQPLPTQPQSTQPASNAATAPPETDDISVLRKRLEQQPAIVFSRPDPTLPVFRLTIEGYQFHMPSWRDNFLQTGPPAPEPPGGSDFYRMQALATGPKAWGTPTPFGATGPTEVSGPGMSGLLVGLLQSAIKARKEAAIGRARAEVQQELAAIEEHNARVAAGAADGDGETDKAAKKKQDDAKKKKKKKTDVSRQ